MKVSSIELLEEMCKPRPVVVSETQDYKPYHVLVYRCAGTCDVNIPPSQKPCTAATKQEIEVPVTDPLGHDRKSIKIYNHTSCSCECNLECNWAEGERQDGNNCKCLKAPTNDKFVGGQKTGAMPSIIILITIKIILIMMMMMIPSVSIVILLHSLFSLTLCNSLSFLFLCVVEDAVFWLSWLNQQILF